MSQLSTLIWLKWRLFRNSLRTSKAVVTRIASILGMLAALAFALIFALALGIAAYALSAPSLMLQMAQSRGRVPSTEFIFFSILSFAFLMWATLPLSAGASKQFDPGRMLMYPISLRKLFALDFLSESTSFQSLFAIPAVIAIGLGAGLGSGFMGRALLATLPIAIFGMALSKWLSAFAGSLLRRKRTGGETAIALIGVLIGLGGALIGQIAPTLVKHAESVRGLRWTPSGAAAFALTSGLHEDATGHFALALAALTGYSVVLILATYWVARRVALGKGGAKRRTIETVRRASAEGYTGWDVPLLSLPLAAVVEKELRYVLRNAQIRMMVFMPLILVFVRLLNMDRGHASSEVSNRFLSDFLFYGDGLMATGGVLYVFLILTGLSCNQFAFEEGGMRSLILSPVERRKILVGKNIAATIVALILSTGLLAINELVFRDLTFRAIAFVALSFVVFSGAMGVIGNWLSVYFPKRMKFGKRMNVSGVVGLLLIPMLVLLALPPLTAVATGYFTGSLLIEYVTLALFATLSVGLYLLLIDSQGRALERREIQILEAVREPTDD